MTAAETGGVITAIPTTTDWEFGGYAYALEPLALPERWLPRTRTEAAPCIGKLRERLTTAIREPCLTETLRSSLRPVDQSDVDRIFWYRWITGHQVTFAIWQILAAVIDEGRSDLGVGMAELASKARLLVCGYSLMLLYAGSPTREIYSRVIRASLARQHANLSGAWARDFAPIRPLLRGKVNLAPGPKASALRRECELAAQIHEGVALKLVPSGISLLQQDNDRRGPWRMPHVSLMWLYDGVFLTNRMNVSYPAVAGQLTRRLHAVVLDVAVNGLSPSFASSQHEEPPILTTRDVVERKESFLQTMLDLMELVECA